MASMDSSSRWWNAETVAVVTGGNKGIGLEVCKQLADKGLKVILTARDAERGAAAANALHEQGLHNIVYHQLDIQDEQSIAAFTSWISKEHGGLDILINNAAVGGVIFDHEYFKAHNIDAVNAMFETENHGEGYVVEYESAKSCLDSNYYGAKRVTKALIPLLRPSSDLARIVNVGSNFGLLCHLQSEELQQELADVDNLSERYIDDLLDKYLDDVKSKSLEGKAWPPKFPSYKMSKVALHAYTRILARDLETRPSSQRIVVNCVHPGFVVTDMTCLQGQLTPAEGAANVVRVALLPHQECPSGIFFNMDKQSDF